MSRFKQLFPGLAASRAKSKATLAEFERKAAQEDYLAKLYSQLKITPSMPPKASETRRQRGKLSYLREDARDVYAKSAFAYRGVQAIVASTVGWGIEPTLTHQDPKRLERIEKEWREWAANCTTDQRDFNSLQSSVMQSIVVDGEAVLKIIPHDGSFKFQELNADFIADASIDSNSREFQVEQGVALDEFGSAKQIFLTKFQPEPSTINEVKPYVLGSEALHVLRKDKANQVRGISWLTRAIEPLRFLFEIQEAHYRKQLVSSAITAVIKNDMPTGSIAQQNLRREELSSLTPGAAVYLNPGESIEMPNMPAHASEFDATTKLTLREAAAALGLFAEQLTQDWSQVNFSASKAARIEHYKMVDKWIWTMFVPQFLTPSFNVFKRHLQLKGIDPTGLEVEWNPGARDMLSPIDEVRANTEAIRSGQKTLPSVLREYGINPKKHLEEIAQTNKDLDALGLILDSDSRRTANGQLVSPEALAKIEDSQKTQQAQQS